MSSSPQSKLVRRTQRVLQGRSNLATCQHAPARQPLEPTLVKSKQSETPFKTLSRCHTTPAPLRAQGWLLKEMKNEEDKNVSFHLSRAHFRRCLQGAFKSSRRRRPASIIRDEAMRLGSIIGHRSFLKGIWWEAREKRTLTDTSMFMNLNLNLNFGQAEGLICLAGYRLAISLSTWIYVIRIYMAIYMYIYRHGITIAACGHTWLPRISHHAGALSNQLRQTRTWCAVRSLRWLCWPVGHANEEISGPSLLAFAKIAYSFNLNHNR